MSATLIFDAEHGAICGTCEETVIPKDEPLNEAGLLGLVREHRCPRTNDCLLPEATEEPAHGSVIMLQGCTGTAYQRLHSTGLWHPTTGGVVLDWADLLAANLNQHPPLLIHDAGPHEEHGG